MLQGEKFLISNLSISIFIYFRYLKGEKNLVIMIKKVKKNE
jgi:hypothetical protein